MCRKRSPPRPASPPAPAPAPAAARPPLEGAIPYKGMRRTVGQRMHESLQSMAQLTLTMDVDMTRAAALRADLVEAWESEGVRLTYTPLALRAAALALRDLPRVNVTLDGDTVRVQPEVHIGNRGRAGGRPHRSGNPQRRCQVLAPHRRGGGRALREGARRRPHPPTILPAAPSRSPRWACSVSTPSPRSSIPRRLRFSASAKWPIRPVLVGESGTQIERRAFMTASLTIDHRILDGAPGAQYLQAFRRYLEHPALLLGD